MQHICTCNVFAHYTVTLLVTRHSQFLISCSSTVNIQRALMYCALSRLWIAVFQIKLTWNPLLCFTLSVTLCQIIYYVQTIIKKMSVQLFCVLHRYLTHSFNTFKCHNYINSIHNSINISISDTDIDKLKPNQWIIVHGFSMDSWISNSVLCIQYAMDSICYLCNMLLF
mgnify:CR=1 FL=1